MCFSSFVAFVLLCFHVVVSVPYEQHGLNKQHSKMKEVHMRSPSYANSKDPYYVGVEPTFPTPIEGRKNRRSPCNVRNQAPQDNLEYPTGSKSITGLDVPGINLNDLLLNQAQRNQRIQLPDIRRPTYHRTNTVPSFYENAEQRANVPDNTYQQERKIPTFHDPATVTRYYKQNQNRYSTAEQTGSTGNSAWKDISSNSKDISDDFVPKQRKRYMIVHSNGSVEIFDKYDDAAKKYPKHVLVRSNEVPIQKGNQQVTPKTLPLRNIPATTIQTKSQNTHQEVTLPQVLSNIKDNDLSERPTKSGRLAPYDLGSSGPNKVFASNPAALVETSTSVNKNVTSKLTSSSESQIKPLNKAIGTNTNVFNNGKVPITVNNNNITPNTFVSGTKDTFKQPNQPDSEININMTEIKKSTPTADNHTTMSENSTKDKIEQSDQHYNVSIVNVTDISKSVTTEDKNLTLLSFRNLTKDTNKRSNYLDLLSFTNSTEINELTNPAENHSSIENSINEDIKQLNNSNDKGLVNNTDNVNLTYEFNKELIGGPTNGTSDGIEANLNKTSAEPDVKDKSEIISITQTEEQNNASTSTIADAHTLQITYESTLIETTSSLSHDNDTTDAENKGGIVSSQKKQDTNPWLENASFWNEIADNNDGNKTIIFIAVSSKPKLSKDTRTTMYPNGVVIEEVRETIQSDDGAPPITTVSKVIYPEGTYHYN